MGERSRGRSPVIAIDGPSGAGKGSVSRAIAEKLGCRYVDSGAMYRALAWMTKHDGLPLMTSLRFGRWLNDWISCWRGGRYMSMGMM